MAIAENENRINLVVKETIARFQQFDKNVEGQKGKLILELARKISLLPGIEKKRIARTMYDKFVEFEYKIARRYIYEILPLEYKNPAKSKASTQMNKARTAAGYDNKLGRIFHPEEYKIEQLDKYSTKTLKVIISYLHGLRIQSEKKIQKLEKKLEVNFQSMTQ